MKVLKLIWYLRDQKCCSMKHYLLLVPTFRAFSWYLYLVFRKKLLEIITRNIHFIWKIQIHFCPLCDIFHHKASLLNQLKPRNENFKQWKQTPHIKLNIVVFTIFRCSSLIFAITWITYKILLVQTIIWA